jgi:DNA-binding NarL/FixJ family response regulator
MKLKVLWVEDGAFSDLAQLSAPLYVSGDYNLVIAEDASEGFRYLMDKEFDAVVMDIRLPPGSDPYFSNLYFNRGVTKVAARLGMAVLERALRPSAENARAWIRPERFGVYTVESSREVAEELDALGVKVYYQKTARTPRDVLVKIVEEIVEAARRKRGAR